MVAFLHLLYFIDHFGPVLKNLPISPMVFEAFLYFQLLLQSEYLGFEHLILVLQKLHVLQVLILGDRCLQPPIQLVYILDNVTVVLGLLG